MNELESKTNQTLSVIATLRGGHTLGDERFDRIFSKSTRALSSRHWTPIAVATWAARILTEGAKKPVRVLDVGCGPGKFCIIGALTTSGHFTGIEQRENFVVEAERIRSEFCIDNLRFHFGNMVDLDWSHYDAFYLFNPFLENVTGLARIDQNVPLSLEYYNDYVAIVESKLAALPVGTKVVTYHGYGGEFPEGYRLESKKSIGTNYLDLWIKE